VAVKTDFSLDSACSTRVASPKRLGESMGDDNFSAKLAELVGTTCEAVDAVEYETPPKDIYSTGTLLRLADRTRVSAQFWRLTKSGKPLVSIFDHRQQYGLPAPIDAIGVLREELIGKPVVDASMNEVTGDLHFGFRGGLVLEVFNFTGFEIWEVVFQDGQGQLSNYALDNGLPPA
jgi:hypothetical protein